MALRVRAATPVGLHRDCIFIQIDEECKAPHRHRHCHRLRRAVS
jgi:hypothetical protein